MARHSRWAHKYGQVADGTDRQDNKSMLGFAVAVENGQNLIFARHFLNQAAALRLKKATVRHCPGLAGCKFMAFAGQRVNPQML